MKADADANGGLYAFAYVSCRRTVGAALLCNWVLESLPHHVHVVVRVLLAAGVGKSTLVRVFVSEVFTEDEVRPVGCCRLVVVKTTCVATVGAPALVRCQVIIYVCVCLVSH